MLRLAPYANLRLRLHSSKPNPSPFEPTLLKTRLCKHKYRFDHQIGSTNIDAFFDTHHLQFDVIHVQKEVSRLGPLDKSFPRADPILFLWKRHRHFRESDDIQTTLCTYPLRVNTAVLLEHDPVRTEHTFLLRLLQNLRHYFHVIISNDSRTIPFVIELRARTSLFHFFQLLIWISDKTWTIGFSSPVPRLFSHHAIHRCVFMPCIPFLKIVRIRISLI